VIDLFSSRQDWVWIARFFCRNQKATFSLLPHQLAPYHKYTIVSISLCLMMAWKNCKKNWSEVLDALSQELEHFNSSLWQMMLWLKAMLYSFRRVQAMMNLKDAPAKALGLYPNKYEKQLEALHDYISTLIDGELSKQSIKKCIHEVVVNITNKTGRFFFGTPSQERGKNWARLTHFKT
jgi:hypothetical protein